MKLDKRERPDMIVRLTSNDCRIIAKIHSVCLADDFLPSFGQKFLEQLYHGILFDKHTIGFGFKNQGSITGFLIGTTNTSGFIKRVLRLNGWRLIPFALRKIITYPRTLMHLIETVFYSQVTNHHHNIPAELLIIAVNETHRRKGVGKKLVQAFQKKLNNAGSAYFIVHTHIDNKAANAFYREFGAKRISSFSLYGKLWNSYRVKTA